MASTAETALAAGVQPEQLDNYLSLIDGAAAMACAPPDEIAQIFLKVQTLGVACTMAIHLLARHNIPIVEWLSAEMGVSDMQVQEAASAGKVNSTLLLAAITNGLNRGDTAAANL